MKNLLNCHTIGVHSFPISFENDFYKRVFYADTNHHLHKLDEIAIHPHHVDIKITVLEGELFNQLFTVAKDGPPYKKYQWESQILNGVGSFKYLGEQNLLEVSHFSYKKGDFFTMYACELHTVFVEEGKVCVWLVEENKPTCEYFPVNYSQKDLTKWSADGLYIEVDDHIKNEYIGKYLNLIS